MQLHYKNNILGKTSPSNFLKKYWQKKPLLIKNVIKNFNSPIRKDSLFKIAQSDDVISRLVEYKNSIWNVRHGPFKKSDFVKKNNTPWTLLLQNMNHHFPFAENFLNFFRFIPYARLDDLMISYASKGGSVGPHYDSYDVFLFQAQGTREWRISNQKKFVLDNKSPIKIISNFKSKNIWTLNPGDMLYLPPNVGHWGIACSDDCLTYSIGFRAPDTIDIQSRFLDFMHDKFIRDSNEIYQDPNLSVQKNPAEINKGMLSEIHKVISRLCWDKNSTNSFIGQFLSEPHENVTFTPPKAINLSTFKNYLSQKTLKLDPKTRMLFIKNDFFVNGEYIETPKKYEEFLRQLANNRKLDLGHTLNKKDLGTLGIALLPLYLCGYIGFV